MFVQLTNEIGSTVAPPVIVQVSITSNFGGLLPQRYLELLHAISDFTGKNLAHGNSHFGKVKEVSLSSFLKDFQGNPPSPSPAPSPEPIDSAEPSISPYYAPSYSPPVPPTASHPCFDCDESSPVPSSIVTEHPPAPCPYSGFSHPPHSSLKSYSNPSFPSPAAAPTSHSPNPTGEVSPDQAPVTEASYGYKPGLGKRRAEKSVSRSLASLSTCKFILPNRIPPFIFHAWLQLVLMT